MRSFYRATSAAASAFFLAPALAMIVLLRHSYCNRTHKFRRFAKRAPAQYTGAPEAVEQAALQAQGAHLPRPRAKPEPAEAGSSATRDQALPARSLWTDRLTITGACDGILWTAGRVELSDRTFVSLWVEGLPSEASLEDVQARLGETDLEVQFVAPPTTTARQINARLWAQLPRGEHSLTVAVGPVEAMPFWLVLE